MIDLQKEGTWLFDWTVKAVLAAIVLVAAMTFNSGCATDAKFVKRVETKRNGGWIDSIEGPCAVSTPRPNEVLVECP